MLLELVALVVFFLTLCKIVDEDCKKRINCALTNVRKRQDTKLEEVQQLDEILEEEQEEEEKILSRLSVRKFMMQIFVLYLVLVQTLTDHDAFYALVDDDASLMHEQNTNIPERVEYFCISGFLSRSVLRSCIT
ncbi:hypothetical protein Aduo_012944 [Ancylostoma duodenale]